MRICPLAEPLRFGPAPARAAEPSLQGQSIASWELVGGRGAQARSGGLKVVTTRLTPGYLRRNGVPYSENAVVTEYFDTHTTAGISWFTVTTIVEDPKYLNQPFVTSSHFKHEPDGSKWAPTLCK